MTRIERLARWLNHWLGWPRDHCERCGGERGGKRGSERVTYSYQPGRPLTRLLLCDYCHADDLAVVKLDAASRWMRGVSF